MNWWIICFLELTFFFGSYFFYTHWWIICFWNLHFWIIFFPHELVGHLFFLELTFLVLFFSHKLEDQYGALYLHCVLLSLLVGSFFLKTNWWITGLHGWSGKSWIILLGRGGGYVAQGVSHSTPCIVQVLCLPGQC